MAPDRPMNRAPRRTIALTAAGVITLVVVAAVILRAGQRLPERFAVVEPGVLYRSAQPSARQIENLVREYGVRTVVIARELGSSRVDNEIEAARRLGLAVVNIPIESRQCIPDEQVRRFFDCIDDPANRPVLVHCSAGRHRTGYLCAMYRIERQRWPVDRAVQEMLSFGFDVEPHAMILEQLRQHAPGRWTDGALATPSQRARPR